MGQDKESKDFPELNGNEYTAYSNLWDTMKVILEGVLARVLLLRTDTLTKAILFFPRTHSVDQAGLELRNPLASASRVLGLKVCTTTAWPQTPAGVQALSFSEYLHSTLHHTFPSASFS